MSIPGTATILFLLSVLMNAVTPALHQSGAIPAPIQSGFGAGAYPAGTAHPLIREMVKVPYPPRALAEGIGGDVVVEALVGQDGGVEQVQVRSSPHPLLDQQVMMTARKWRFHPAKLDGKAVSVVVPIVVTFSRFLRGETLINSSTWSRVIHVSDTRWPADVVRGTAPGVSLASVKRDVKPGYTPDAMRDKVQGKVEMEIVVGTDGSVTHARVVKSLDSQLDSQALLAAREWTFAPCRLNAAPVACSVNLVLEFRLH
jgi:TonB family protein